MSKHTFLGCFFSHSPLTAAFLILNSFNIFQAYTYVSYRPTAFFMRTNMIKKRDEIDICVYPTLIPIRTNKPQTELRSLQ